MHEFLKQVLYLSTLYYYPLTEDNQVWFKIQQQFCGINYPIL